ncbi:MAG: class I SAM-dependent methyltransferase [Candidatus Brocadia sp.]|nr:class I SAM-dependent methyltransferase [Candidatus Brocadia sp.]
MDIKAVETKFINILKNLKKNEDRFERCLGGYSYIQRHLQSEQTMFKYFYDLLNNTKYIRNSIEGNTLIDAGCGSGAFSLLLSLLGSKKVYAVDFLPECTEMAKEMVRIAEQDNIEVIQSDVGNLSMPEGSIDGIFSIEAISHYRDYKTFFIMASKSLKHGGFIVISDGNNGTSPSIRKKTYKIWDIFENHRGAITIEGHTKGDECYFDARKQIIRSEFPTLSETEVETFAKYSFGYSQKKVIEAANKFKRGDFSMKSEYSYGKCPLDPVTDCYMEKLFNPGDLKKELSVYGFKSRVYSVGPAKKSLRLLNHLWELLTPLTIYLPRAFKIIAIKNG